MINISSSNQRDYLQEYTDLELKKEIAAPQISVSQRFAAFREKMRATVVETLPKMTATANKVDTVAPVEMTSAGQDIETDQKTTFPQFGDRVRAIKSSVVDTSISVLKNASTFITMERVAGAAVLGFAMTGAYIAATGSDLQDAMDGVAVAASGSGLVTTVLGTASILRGKTDAGKKQLAAGLGLLAAGVTLTQMSFEPQKTFAEQQGPVVNSGKYDITFGTTYLKGNAERDSLSQMVNENHMEYAVKWNIQHRVVEESLMKDSCTHPITNTQQDCVAYWNKVAVLREWLQQPEGTKEEWYIIADDDMPVTNMRVNPYEVIDKLRRKKDTSVIIATDVVPWNGDHLISVNTGLMMVRKDEASRKFIETLWEKRNTPTKRDPVICPSLGLCQNQDTLHEQEAFSNILKQDRSLIDSVVTVIKPRDTYEGEEIAINTFNRGGCFYRVQQNWRKEKLEYKWDRQFPNGAYRKGDFLPQTAGVPIKGMLCDANGDPSEEISFIREDKLKDMLGHVVRTTFFEDFKEGVLRTYKKLMRS